MADNQEPRVPFVDAKSQLSPESRHHFESIEESRGGVRGPFTVLLNSPEVAGRVGHLGAYLRYESTLRPVERELAILTTAREFECAYEWAAHEPIARETGVREVAVDAVSARGSVDGLSDVEACIVSFGRELFRDHAVSDETFRAAKRHFGVQGVTELVATMGYYGLLACVLNAFEVTPDEGTPSFS